MDSAFGYWILLADQKWSSLISGIEMAARRTRLTSGSVCPTLSVLASSAIEASLQDLLQPSYLAPRWSCARQRQPRRWRLVLDYGIDLPSFSALECWTALRAGGTKKLGRVVTDNCRQAARMAAIIKDLNKAGSRLTLACGWSVALLHVPSWM